ncbi:MAG TPA: DNA replication/repair protein RecF [Bacteroidia bacterium]
MHLKKLSLVNFKNYAQAELEPGPGVNCFAGPNGTGKTNLLDAIHYLSFCKSFFNPIDSQNILHEAPFFVVQGWFEREGEEEEIYCGQKRGQKKQFKRNKKEYSRLADHIGLLPCVMMSPSDTELIYEGSEERRKFMDSIISQSDREYLEELIHYNKVLLQRNALLRQFGEGAPYDKASLEIWDEQLVKSGTIIYKKRMDFMAHFIQLFREHYKFISEGREEMNVHYESQLHHGDLKVLLETSVRKDMAVEYTTHGIHKDDLEFKLGDHPVKKFGSQGQQKSLLVALRLAQFDFIAKLKKVKPILLLDDIYDKLDDMRVRKLMELVSSHRFGQIFITDTNAERIKDLFKGIDVELRMFEVSSESGVRNLE